MNSSFEDLGSHLPLPLARLYRRAGNAKDVRERHNAAYYLWEAGLKLLGSVVVVSFAEQGQPDPVLSEALQNLARPSVGHWWEFVRLLLPLLGKEADSPFSSTAQFFQSKPRADLPRCAGLEATLFQVLDGKDRLRASVAPAELFNSLVRYRNREFGQGRRGRNSRVITTAWDGPCSRDWLNSFPAWMCSRGIGSSMWPRSVAAATEHGTSNVPT